MSEGRVIVVDADVDLQRKLVLGLRAEGLAAEGMTSGRAAIVRAAEWQADAVVLDWMLPDVLGTAVCGALRAREETRDVGILLLTARGGERDRIEGLEAGADDYVIKPCSVRELALRLRALARRTREARPVRSGPERVHRVVHGALEVDLATQRVSAAGQEVQLRPLEFKLLAMLMTRAGRTLSRSELLDAVWGRAADSESRTIDTHVRRLREKLGGVGSLIETVHRSGYRIRAA